MKLQDLDLKSLAQRNKKVFENHFGKLPVEKMSLQETRTMLKRVRGLINEHRARASYSKSERNPAYLKLLVLEQTLAAKVREAAPVGTNVTGTTAGNTAAGATGQTDVEKKALDATLTKAVKDAAAGRTPQGAEKEVLQKQMTGLDKVMSNPQLKTQFQGIMQKAGVAESRKLAEMRKRFGKILSEAEIQQAQVVLGAQDMIDRMQKMTEDASSMQFKDLPALVDQVKQQVGVDQAQQYNTAASAALGGLVSALQGAKSQLEAAQGILTGQAPVVPGADGGVTEPAPAGELPGGELPEPDLGAEAGEAGGEMPDLGGEEEAAPEAALGRKLR